MADRYLESEHNKRPRLPSDQSSDRSLSAGRITRRVEQRLGVDSSVVIHLIDIAVTVQGRIVDISPGGCHIRTDQRFSVGIFRRVEVESRIEGLPFRLAGVTQAMYDPFNVGIRFLDLSERKRKQLLQLIEEIE